jgi:hypothetical protein
MVQEIKLTEIGKTYWEETAIYQNQYEQLFDKLVPRFGSAKTINGELIRVMSNLTHEFFNNGNGNAVEEDKKDCRYCNGTGYEVIDHYDEDEYSDEDCRNCGGECEILLGYTITPFYQKMIDFLHQYVDEKEKVKQFEKFIIANELWYDNPHSHIYTELMDMIMYQILTNDTDKPNPYFDENEFKY